MEAGRQAGLDHREATRTIRFSKRSDVDVREGVVAGTCGDGGKAVAKPLSKECSGAAMMCSDCALLLRDRGLRTLYAGRNRAGSVQH